MKKSQAFSLLEMLVALAIFGVLVAISYPSYSHYFLQQHRLTAKVTLFKLASAMESYYSDNHSYVGASLEKLNFYNSAAKYYELSIDAATEGTYVLSAKPVNSQTSDECGELHLTGTGEKTASGDNKQCWS